MSASIRHPLARLLPKTRLRVLGINSGTSIDGLDLALTEISDSGRMPQLRLIASHSLSFPRRLQSLLRDLAAKDTVGKHRAAYAHYALGQFAADAVVDFASEYRNRRRIDLVACHGQTIGHFPETRDFGVGRHSATWQLGALNAIAQRSGIVTIGDFRAADVSAGGMGAPLSGYYHHLLFGPDMVVLNLGGIANVSVSRLRRRRLEVRAFDTGPGNMLCDELARRLMNRACDRGGRVASGGKPVASIVRRALSASYFKERPPKSCGREQFGAQTADRLFFRGSRQRAETADLMATAVEITAQTVAEAMRSWVSRWTDARTLVLCGGGTNNRFLVKRIAESLAAWRVCCSDDYGIPAQFVEPVGFAVLAHETLRARAGNLGGATGGQPSVLGLIALPGTGTV